MATTASPEASEIRRRGRRRLIGAIVLVVLAVVFVPMILDSEPRQKRTEPSLDIPPKDKAPPLPPPTKTAVIPVPEKPVPLPEPKVEPPKTVAKAAPKTTETPTSPKLEGFAVQVGAFKDEDKLNQARQKLMAARIPHFVEHRGDLNRLRAGPYPDRAAAEKALAAVKATSLDGQVVPLP